MTHMQAISAGRIFDGKLWHADVAVLAEAGRVIGFVPSSEIPLACDHVALEGLVVPGFVDLQVNGGGGVLFNNAPTAASIATICNAHAQFGTTALLVTLITDTAEVNERAIAAGAEAAGGGVAGFLGLHLEGPHLSRARKGTHDPDLIRPMEPADLERILGARDAVPNLLCTVAPESVSADQIARLREAGIVVSLGHSDTGYAGARGAFAAGATMSTHLFNAMSQLGNREPGLVGAVLDEPEVHAGLIADGIHVHPAAIGIALRAKQGPGKIFLVTDSMSQTGTDLTTLTLNGRTIYRADGALRLADGTLAGADLDMIDAVRFMIDEIGVERDEVLRMAALYPAEAMGIASTHGHLRPGAVLDFVQLSDELDVRSTWIGGRKIFG